MLCCWLSIAALDATGLAQNEEQVTLRFGTYSFKKATDVYKEFEPVITALQPSLQKALGRPVKIELRITKTYEECLQAFVSGGVDFVRFGPASYVLAKELQPKVQLLAVEQEDGKLLSNTGVIVVRANSKIRSLGDLKGCKFAFGDDQSTIGRFLAQAELVKAGVTAKDLAAFQYLDRHDRVFDAVEAGGYDAGALHLTTFKKRNDRGQLRVLYQFDNVGKPWIARAGLDAAITDALHNVLLHLTDRDALAALCVTGLMATDNADFDYVRKAMLVAERFAEPATKSEPAKPDK